MNRMNIICPGVRDIVKARAFYRDGLGFTTPSKEDKPDVVFFSNGALNLNSIHLRSQPETSMKRPPPMIGTGFSGITLAFNAKTKAEVDIIFAKVESLGRKIAKRPETAFWGGYSGYIQDLDE